MQATRGGFDAATMAEALARPGIDPREWISYGIVLPSQQVDGETIDSVEFDDELGPLVNVRLQPSATEVRARVATRMAGAGEGEYVPFIEGDEVIVAIPMGDTRGGCVIFGKLNNAIDKWPSESIAGQDPTKNTFAFTRSRTPYVTEYASSYMLRHAKHGAFILIADSGVITIRDGSKGALQMGPDLFGYQEGTREVGTDATPSPKALLQLDLTGRRLTMQVDDAQLMLNSSSADNNAGNVYLTSPGEFSAILGTNVPGEHVATIEAVVSLLQLVMVALGPLFNPGQPPATMQGLLATALAALAINSIEPLTVAPALALALQAAGAIPKGPVDPVLGVQTKPGLGALLFKTG